MLIKDRVCGSSARTRGDGEGRRASGAPALSCSPSLSFLRRPGVPAPPWTNSHRIRCFQQGGGFSLPIFKNMFFTHLAFYCSEVEVEGKRQAGSPLLALNGRRVKNSPRCCWFLFTRQKYTKANPRRAELFATAAVVLRPVHKLLAANQSSRAHTPCRNPPPLRPGPFRTHLRGIDPSLRRPTDSYFLRAPPPRHPISPSPSANGCHLFSSSISVVAARTD